MTQTQLGASGLVRVTIASGRRRVDLVLPAAVPVAELVPELARSVGLLDGATVYGGYRVVTQDGRVLAHDAGLLIQGVEDGSLLTVSAGVDEAPPRVYDDVVEAMTDVVESELRPWEPAAGRRTALGAAALLLGIGGYSLLLQTDHVLGAVSAGVVAALLTAAAVVLSRVQGERQAAVVVGVVASLYGGVVGALAGRGEAFLGMGGTYVGAGIVVVSFAVIVGLEEGRPLLVPPIFVGGVLAVLGWVFDATDLDPAAVLTALLVLVVVSGSVFPWLALSATSTRVDQLVTIEDIEATPEDVDADRVLADARAAHEILVGLSVTVGATLVLVAPLAVSLGVLGTVTALLSAAVVMLRTRQYRTGTEVLAGLVAGILALVVVALSVLVLHPDWRATAAVCLAVAGGLVLAATLVPGTTSVRRARLGDVAETVALLALFPALALAINLFGIADLVGG